MLRVFRFSVLASLLMFGISLPAQVNQDSPEQAQVVPPDQVQVALPNLQRPAPPDPDALADDLEKKGDDLRADKAFLDALDYYRAALKKNPKAQLYNKTCMTELLLRRPEDAKKDCARATKKDHAYADAYNNLGVAYYLLKDYSKAISQYKKALKIRQDSASFYSNLGSAYFAKKEFLDATLAYQQAVQIDPDIFERSSRAGVVGQISSPADRARFDFVLAKLYAKMGSNDRSLQCLRKALEEGYPKIDDVYKDDEFAELRKDPRFNELMAARPPAIPQ